MKKLLIITTLFFLLSFTQKTVAQEIKKLTFDEVIKLSEEQSTSALMARQAFKASYWQFRSYQAQFRPSLTLRGTVPNYTNGFSREFNAQTGQYTYFPINTIQSSGTLSLSQSIGLTSTTLSLQSSLNHLYDFTTGARIPRQYNITPVSININQPIRQYSSLRWQRKIEPVKYEAAKRTYLSAIEDVHVSAVSSFFQLALAQINKQIADMNYTNDSSLYEIAHGRYELGTIALDDLLQMELQFLNAETARKTADMNLRDREIRLRSFLGFTDQVRLELILPTEIPALQVDAKEVLDLAMANSPDILTQTINVLNAESSLAQARANKGLTATLQASLGLSQRGADFTSTLQNPNQSQSVNIGFTVPILDWGRGRGNYRMAQSSLDLANVRAKQAIIDFQQNLALSVEQFNLQKEQVRIAAKSDTVAMQRFEITRQRFLIGKIAVLDLNDADVRKDDNRRAYVQSVQTYWNYFYNLRGNTLYDFINRKPLETDYEKIIKEQ
jgi:outer membrane protein TolC